MTPPESGGQPDVLDAAPLGGPVRDAVLLAAGRGSRLRPHTDDVPKPLLPWQGRPTLDHLVDGLQAAGIQRVWLVVHHLAETVERWADERHDADPAGPAFTCVSQRALAGTADALDAVAPSLLSGLAQDDTPFLLSATDYLLPPAFYPTLMRFHASHDAAASASLKRLPPDELAARSSIRFASGAPAAVPGVTGDEVLEIVEKPAPGQAPSSIGANLMFVLPRRVLPFVAAVTPSPRGEREVQAGINAWLASGGRCRGLIQATPPEWTPACAELESPG